MNDLNETLCCSACGLLMQDQAEAHQINCPRCESSVRKRMLSINYNLAMAIAAFIIFFPAMSLPILTFKIGNSEQTSTMFSSLYYFYEGGYPELSVLVMLTSIIAPFMQILISILMFYPLSKNEKPKYMKFYFKALFEIRQWVMLDVYAIAILVSIVKLSSISELVYEDGLVMFSALMVFSFLLTNSFAPKHIWRVYHNAH